jgi:uncharacterized protein (DUF4415 family)
MKKPEHVRVVLVDRKPFKRVADGGLAPLVDETDYALVDSLSADEIEAIARNDSDAAPMTDDEWARSAVRQPIKKPVGLKLDDDVLDWFKSRGRGYQTRINAVLRRYIEAQKKTG